MSEPSEKLVNEFTVAVLQLECARKHLEEIALNIRKSLWRMHKLAGMEEQMPIALKEDL